MLNTGQERGTNSFAVSPSNPILLLVMSDQAAIHWSLTVMMV